MWSTMIHILRQLPLTYCLCCILLPKEAASLPPGFVKELVANTPAVTGTWAANPRQDGKPMLIVASKTGKVRAIENPDVSDKLITMIDLRFDKKRFMY